MRLLECLDTIDPSNGGGVEGTKRRCGMLQAMGHTVEMLSLDDPGAGFLKLWPVPVHALGPARGSFGYAPDLRNWVEDNARRFDALIVNGIWRYHALGISRGLKKSGVPYFVIPHSQLNPWFGKAFPLKHLKKNFIWKVFQWKVLRDARAVFFTCDMERELARDSFSPYKCHEEVVSLAGTSVPEMDRSTARRDLEARYPELQGKRIVLFVSRLHPMKGCDLLIKAFEAVCIDSADMHLLIAGPGDDAYALGLRALTAGSLSRRVTWMGEISDEMKWKALLSCELFALPSHCEATPLAVAEALGCGVPALITDQVNIWKELVEAGAALVGPDTEAGTRESLQRWMRMPNAEMVRMRDSARACFLRYYDSQSNTSSFIEGLKRNGIY